MTSRQKRILATLAISNAVIFLILAALATRQDIFNPSPPPTPSAEAPRPRSRPEDTAQTSPSPTPATAPLERCQWKATQILAQHGLSGAVTLTSEGSLRFEIPHHLKPGQRPEDAAQLVWNAFDVALALAHDRCDTFSRIEIAMEAQGVPSPTRIYAAVDVADLKALDSGELSERAFIDRVQYGTQPLDGS